MNNIIIEEKTEFLMVEMSDYEYFSLWITVITSLLFIIGLSFTIYQVYLNTKAQRQNHDWNRRFAAQEALARGQNDLNEKREVEEHFGIIKKLGKIPLEEINEKLEKNPTLIVSLHRMLNIYEAYCRGIVQGIYDSEVIKSARASAMKQSYFVFEEYINHRRQISNPRAWTNFERILNDWKQIEKGKTITYRKRTA